MPLLFLGITVVLVVVFIARGVRIVPQQSAYVVERLGKFHKVLQAGITYIVPFIDTVAYKHTLKEQSIDIPEQVCITKDNVQVSVDGVIFIQVVDPKMASYGIRDYTFAITQLAQTTMRSEVGKIDLDKTFEERTNINSSIVTAIDEAARSWGVKILRYEVKILCRLIQFLEPWRNRCRLSVRKERLFCSPKGKNSLQSTSLKGRNKK